MPCFGWRWHWQHGQFFEICVINKGGLYPTRGMLRLCVHPARESVHVQDMAGFSLGIHFLRRTYLALLLTGYKQVVGQGVASIDNRVMASSLSARPSQQSYSEADCDQGGEWPKTRSLHPLRRASVSAYPQIIGNVRGDSPAASYCFVRPVEVKWKALNYDLLFLD